MGAVLTHGSVAERQAVVGAAGARAGADGAWSEWGLECVSASSLLLNVLVSWPCFVRK